MSIEGGDADLREGMSDTDKVKRLHTHILLQLPQHINFETFRTLIRDCWKDTSWAYDVDYIEPIKSHYGSARYNSNSTLDAIDLHNTNFANGSRAN